MNKINIEYMYKKLRDNFNVQNGLGYLNFINKQTPSFILENSKYVYSVNIGNSTDIVNDIILKYDFDKVILEQQKVILEDFIKKVNTLKDSALNDYKQQLNVCLDNFNIIINRLDDKNYIRESSRRDFLDTFSVGLLEGITEMNPIIANYEVVNPMQDLLIPNKIEKISKKYADNPIKESEMEYGDKLITFSLTDFDNDEELLEAFNDLTKVYNSYKVLNRVYETLEDELITEGNVSNAVRKVAVKTSEVNRNAVNKIRKIGDDAKHVKIAAKKIIEPADNLVNNTLDRLKNLDKDERRRKIIEGGFKFKLLTIIRNAIVVTGTAFMIHPAIAAIGMLTAIALDKKASAKERNQILKELETELKIVEEKIEDARSDQDKKHKYELIRIKNKLEDDIARIKYRLG